MFLPMEAMEDIMKPLAPDSLCSSDIIAYHWFAILKRLQAHIRSLAQESEGT